MLGAPDALPSATRQQQHEGSNDEGKIFERFRLPIETAITVCALTSPTVRGRQVFVPSRTLPKMIVCVCVVQGRWYEEERIIIITFIFNIHFVQQRFHERISLFPDVAETENI